MGFSHGIGMSLSIRVQNVVPSDSEIVVACKRGDVLAVRELLKFRRASPNDIAETNETLLMVCQEVIALPSEQSLSCSVCN
jgi:hypothetical protein